MQRIKNIVAVTVSIAAIAILLITSVDSNAFNREFFESEYASMKTADYIGMSQKDLMRATNTLLDYLQDDRDDISVKANVNGEMREVFNKRESDHMIDVKNLYQNVLKVRLAAAVVLVIGIALLLWKWRQGLLGSLAYRFMQVSLAFLVVIGMLCVWALIDFYSFWTSFHELFFTNDLWLLNPATDIMIQMFPQDFFYHMVMRIVIGFAVPFAVLFGGSLLYIKRRIKSDVPQEKKNTEAEL